MDFLKSPMGIIIILAVLVLGIGTFFFFSEDKQDNTKPALMGQEIAIQGKNHIEVGAAHEPYNSSPPTSGPHYAQAAARDFYEGVLPDEQLIHNLEHGEIWISYKNILDDVKQELKALQASNRGSVVVTLRPDNPQNICLASWGRLQCMDQLDLPLAQQFIKANKNNSPEPFAR